MLLLLGVGLWSFAANWFGHPVVSTVRSCETELHLYAGAEPADLVVHGTTATVRFGDEQ